MLHLDDLDVKIIRELGSPSSPQWNVRESYANISRKLGVDEDTVRLRVKRAVERGFLPRWRLTVNPRLLDFDAVSFELEVDSEEKKPRAISQIELVDGVTRILDYRGRGLLVTLYSAEESLSRRIQLIESICGSAKSAVWKNRFPRPDVRMKKIDWRIVNNMREDARRDLKDVANSLGVSTRTVQRRLAAMTEGKAIYLVGAPNVETLSGLLCCFVVFCPDPLRKKEVDTEIRSSFSRLGISDMSPERHSIFGIPCQNLAEADRTLDSLKSIDGVEKADMRIMKQVILVQDWLKSEIERRASADKSTGASVHAALKSAT